MRSGLIVMLVGILFLFKNLNLIDPVSWNILWPLIVMMIGISMVLRGKCACGGWGCKWCKGSNQEWQKKCDCDCAFCKECRINSRG